MPVIPRAYAEANVPGFRLPAPTPQSFGAGAFAEIGRELQNQADLEETQRLQTYDIGIQTQIRQAVIDARTKAGAINDPDQFQQVYEQELIKFLPALQAQVQNDPKRSIILGRRYNEQIRSEADNIAAGVSARRRDTVLATVQKLSQLGKEKVQEGGDPLGVIKEFDAQIDTAPYLMRDEQEKIKEHFRNTISKDYLFDEARRRPLDFAAAVEHGDYKGLSQDFLDEALSIASRITANRDRAESKADQARGDAARRAFTTRAQAHQLDETQLLEAATWYKWDKDKVDKILKIQYGIREGSAYSERIIADAMAPLNKVAPTLDDVKLAEANLADIADRVSSKSKEYEQAVNKARGIRNNLLRPGGPENQLRIKANRRLAILVDLYHIDDKRDEDWVSKTLTPIRETMRVMGEKEPEKLDAYLDNLERLWKVGKQENQITDQARERALGLGKK